jgi:hypothetical protein
MHFVLFLIDFNMINLQCNDHPANDGVIRVDNYWCHSAILSTRPKDIPVSLPVKTSYIDDNSGSVNSPNNVSSSSDRERAYITASSLPITGRDIELDREANFSNNSNRNEKNSNKRNKIEIFDPKARLNDLRKNSSLKTGSLFAAKLRIKAREALKKSKNPFNKINENFNRQKDKKGHESARLEPEIETKLLPKISAVDLPGMSFITLFCDDQKVF